jgi:hypothetical protein
MGVDITWDTLNKSVQLAMQQSQVQCENQSKQCQIDVVNLGEFRRLRKQPIPKPKSDLTQIEFRLGDEIGVTAPPTYANDTSWKLYCQQHGISLDMLGCDGGNWTICTTLNPNTSTAAVHPGLYYHSMMFMNSAAISYYGNITSYLRTLGLERAKFGANMSPYPGNYIGLTFMWVRLFRERAFTLPWGEVGLSRLHFCTVHARSLCSLSGLDIHRACGKPTDDDAQHRRVPQWPAVGG